MKLRYVLELSIRWAELAACRQHFLGLVRKVLPIGVRHRNWGLVVLHSIYHLHWQAKLQIKQACLAHILNLRTCLANFCLLVSCSCTRFPPEHSKRSCTDLALFVKLSLCHAHKRIIPKTCLADDGKFRDLPPLLVDIILNELRHSPRIGDSNSHSQVGKMNITVVEKKKKKSMRTSL